MVDLTEGMFKDDDIISSCVPRSNSKRQEDIAHSRMHQTFQSDTSTKKMFGISIDNNTRHDIFVKVERDWASLMFDLALPLSYVVKYGVLQIDHTNMPITHGHEHPWSVNTIIDLLSGGWFTDDTVHKLVPPTVDVVEIGGAGWLTKQGCVGAARCFNSTENTELTSEIPQHIGDINSTHRLLSAGWECVPSRVSSRSHQVRPLENKTIALIALDSNAEGTKYRLYINSRSTGRAFEWAYSIKATTLIGSPSTKVINLPESITRNTDD